MTNKKQGILNGVIWKEMILFAFPIFLSYLFQNLYNSVDSLIVGNFVSKEALAAVSNCSTVTNIMVGFFTGLSSGAMTIFSRYYGANKLEEFDKSIHTAITFAIVFGFGMAAVGFMTSRFLLNWMNFPQEVTVYALPYLKVYFLGSIFTAVFNIGSGISRSIGDSKTPFHILIVTTVINTVLDVVFVAVFHLSVVGVAMSTIFAQMTSSILIILKLTKNKQSFDLQFGKLGIDKEMLKEIVIKGLPAGIQTSMISFSNSLMQRYVNAFDTNIITGIGVAKKVDNFVSMPTQSIGIATATFVSQNYGAGNKDRIKKIIKTSIVLMIISVTMLAVPIVVFSDQLVYLFNKDVNVIAAGSAMIHVIAPLYYFHGLMEIMVGVNRGFGKAIQVMIFSMTSMIVIRQTFLAIAFSIQKNIFFIHICYPMCWAVAALFNVIYFFGWVKKKYLD